MTQLERLGRVVAGASDAQANTADTLAAARARWMAPGPRRTARPRLVLALAALVGFALAGVLWVMLPARQLPAAPPALAFETGSPLRPGTVGEWVSADEEDTELRFADGTVFRLRRASRARVTATSPDGADLVLEQGALEARVTPRGGARWTIGVGPFVVRVTGTAFTLRWDTTARRLALTVSEGSVAVAGPLLPQDRPVVAGESLVVDVSRNEMQLTRGAGPAPRPSGPPADARPALEDGGAAADPTATSAPRSPEWRALLAAGEARAAVGALARDGVAVGVGQATVSELWQLADAARLAGRADVAVAALEALRARGVRGSTAFLLGKVAADQQGSPGAAIRWFEAYLAEAPGGPLAEEALGRLMTLQRRSNPSAARATARRYLARYPKGAYAGLARSLD